MKFVILIFLSLSISSVYGQEKESQTIDIQNNQQAYIDYLKKHLKYPETAKRDSIEGKVLIAFQINKKGEISKVKVNEGIREDLDNEALRFVKSMPNWEPGKDQYGRPKKVDFVLPIVFKL